MFMEKNKELSDLRRVRKSVDRFKEKNDYLGVGQEDKENSQPDQLG